MTANPISADFPYPSRYIDVNGSQIHYVEQGDGDPILFLHGNPTSSYLWRNIIPYVSGLGRCIAPDLIGMGKSDQPDIDYRFVDHVQYVEGFIKALGLRNITLVVHDWGSALGFHYAMGHQDNVKALVFMEAILTPVPTWEAFPADFRELFQAFRTPDVGWEMIVNQNIFIEKVLPGGVMRPLTNVEMDYYRAPYPEMASRKPVWRWPNEIPIAGEPTDVVAIVNDYNAKLQQSDLPKLMFTVNPGALLPAPIIAWCQQNLKNLTTIDLGAGLHFVQEDHPHEIGAALAKWYQAL